jgi:hypothetical protein
MKIAALILFILLFPTLGCGVREREKALDAKAVALDQREQELLLREKSLQLKEEEFLRKEQLRDSTQKTDSLVSINPQLTGTWSVKMTCTETTCSSSAVGDTRTEQWHINYQDNNLIVRAMSGDQLIRVYTGTYTNESLDLVNDPTAVASQPAAKMVVRLRVTSNNTMEGQREILREGNCRIVYAMQMTKQ